MAEKKSLTQAEKAAGKKKNGAAVHKEKQPVQEPESAGQIPVRLITSAVSLTLFVVFLVMLLKPDGAIPTVLNSVVLGMFGRVGFYIAIPAMVYMFVIQAFSGKRPVIMRSVCLIAFILICGCIAHLVLNPKELPDGIALIGALYKGGVEGTTGGVICGGFAMLLKLLLGSVLPYFALIIAAVFTLLASIQITVPSLIRAVRNRPKADWENRAEEPKEPAAVVVNHLANKRIEYVERRRAKAEQPPVLETPAGQTPPAKRSSRASELMRQIDGDVTAPVAAAGARVEAGEDEHILTDAPVEAAPAVPLSPEPVIPEAPVADIPVPAEVSELATTRPEPVKSQQPVNNKKVTARDAEESAQLVAQEIAAGEAEQKPEYCFPPVDLLKIPQGSAADGTEEMRENSRRLNETLESFKIEAHIINVTRGSSVTRYEVELEKGVRLNKLTSCADDIALSLGASGVRIAAVPGKISVVGIEVPNRSVTTVSLREVIDSNEFGRAKSKSSFAVGKDIGGSCIVGNIAKLPHMLIAGTTGSGKSVCMNSIIISLLYKASPEDVKLIMVDPKMVERGIYNGSPHLLIPVVTDPKKAAGSLQWAVTEMMRRYKAMSDAGVRDLESYNSIMESQEGAKLPQVVVIIDELADLMLVAAKEVEESICRIAQMGRASGIHLVIATQRPSADVITGLMKANIPSRIAFAVASAMESRIILDAQGAEKLVGKGDMLFAPFGSGKPLRVQGCFVSDGEVEAVATYVKNHFVVDYDQEVMEEIERKAAQTGNKPAAAPDPEPNAEEIAGDEMLPAAVEVILETGQASVSMLQRRLKLGYARAARIVDEMEERGIVGPFKGSKPREILVTKEQWDAMQGGQPSQMDFDDLPFDEDNESDFEGVPEEID